MKAILITVLAAVLAGCHAPNRTTMLPTPEPVMRQSRAPAFEPYVPETETLSEIVAAFRRACLTKGGFKIEYEGEVEHYRCARIEEDAGG